MITLRGMAKHSFSNIYNYQCLEFVLYLYTWILIFPLNPFPSYLLSPSYTLVGPTITRPVQNPLAVKLLDNIYIYIYIWQNLLMKVL